MTETTLPPGQAARLAVLLDALGGVPISDAERRSLVWLAEFEAATVASLAAVITRARQTRYREMSDLPTTGDLVKSGS